MTPLPKPSTAPRPHRTPPALPARMRALRTVVGATSLLALAACGGGGGSGGGSTAPPPPAPTPVGALTASAPGQLLGYVRDRARQQLQARSGSAADAWAGGAALPTTLAGVGLTASTTTTTAPRSGTPAQEAGVDEADLLKTDGTRVVALVPQPDHKLGEPAAMLLVSTRLPDGTLRSEARAGVLQDPELPVSAQGLLLHSPSQQSVVVGQSTRVVRLDDCGGVRCEVGIGWGPVRIENTVHVDLMDLSRPDRPAVRQRLHLEGRLLGTRQIGGMAYVVTQHTPTLPTDGLLPQATAVDREAAVAAISNENLLPRVRVDRGASQPLVNDTDCWIQPDNASPGVEITVVTAIDLAAPGLPRRSRCFAGGAEALYLSTEALVLATSRYAVQAVQAPAAPGGVTGVIGSDLGGLVSAINPILVIRPPEMRTDLHKFALRNGDLDYRGSGEVMGHLGWDTRQASYRLSEHEGHLRVLTFTGQVGWFCGAEACIAQAARTAEVSPARLTVLRESTARRALEVVATLPNDGRPAPLGKPGEQVYGVRFAGNRAYVVTFRQTDPLYVLDLSTPADPRVAGELELPGFSSWLFPLADGQLLGVGRDADASGQRGGVKVALFDVRQPSAPRLLDSVTWGGAASLSGLDLGPHGIDLLPRGDRTRMAMPVLVVSERGQPGVSYRALKRLEIDATAGRLVPRPDVESASQALWGDLGFERSVQVGDTLIHLSGGTLRATVW